MVSGITSAACGGDSHNVGTPRTCGSVRNEEELRSLHNGHSWSFWNCARFHAPDWTAVGGRVAGKVASLPASGSSTVAVGARARGHACALCAGYFRVGVRVESDRVGGNRRRGLDTGGGAERAECGLQRVQQQ